MTAEIGILNVGAGDNKLVFDPKDPGGMVRAARIISDMLKRGYALLIEVDDGAGGKTTRRVHEFREDTYEYIIADFDPVQAAEADQEEKDGKGINGATAAPLGSEERSSGKRAPTKPAGRRVSKRAVPAAGTPGIAVARIAGG